MAQLRSHRAQLEVGMTKKVSGYDPCDNTTSTLGIKGARVTNQKMEFMAKLVKYEEKER